MIYLFIQHYSFVARLTSYFSIFLNLHIYILSNSVTIIHLSGSLTCILNVWKRPSLHHKMSKVKITRILQQLYAAYYSKAEMPLWDERPLKKHQRLIFMNVGVVVGADFSQYI